MDPVTLTAIPNVPDIKPGDDLAQLLGDALDAADLPPRDGDVLCIAHKVFSKAEGNVVRLADVTPSPEAEKYAAELNKDPRKVEVILGESKRVVRAFRHERQREGVMICEHRLGFTAASAAVDASNVAGEGTLVTLPKDPDASAHALKSALEMRFGCAMGVVMTDTFGRPWRLGQVNFAIGLADVPTTTPEMGNPDAWGQMLFVTEPALADEIAAASGLVVRKAAKTPLVHIRGLDWTPDPAAKAHKILRSQQENMF